MEDWLEIGKRNISGLFTFIFTGSILHSHVVTFFVRQRVKQLHPELVGLLSQLEETEECIANINEYIEEEVEIEGLILCIQSGFRDYTVQGSDLNAYRQVHKHVDIHEHCDALCEKITSEFALKCYKQWNVLKRLEFVQNKHRKLCEQLLVDNMIHLQVTCCNRRLYIVSKGFTSPNEKFNRQLGMKYPHAFGYDFRFRTPEDNKNNFM